MTYALYSIGLATAALLSSPWWLLKMLRQGKYRAGTEERMGRVAKRIRRSEERGSIWVHAVSVGEVLACSGLIAGLRTRFPERRIVISTTTATGQTLARQRFGEENVFYFPLDFAFAIRPWLRALRPDLVVLAETEFWPNFLHLAHESGARIAVVNARISDRSFPRYHRLRFAVRRILQNIDLFLAQTEQDRSRLIAIGAPPGRVHTAGNLKFEVSPPNASGLVGALRFHLEATGTGPVLVFGSTVEGEEALLIPAWRSVLEKFPAALIVLAPRHPERFDSVAEILRQSGLKYFRRSSWNSRDPLAKSILLLDSIGELASIYQLAQIAFVGGSLVPRGGHNILEPAQAGAAILTGPHTENFRDIVSIFRRENAVRIVTPDAVSPVLLELLATAHLREELGRKAQEVVRSQVGATARTLNAIEALLSSRPAPQVPGSSAPVADNSLEARSRK